MVFYQKVIEGNIEVHKQEAKYYDAIHNEIWNRSEQKRLKKLLRELTQKIDNQTFRALDFGCGTGNLTQKLLELGYSVLAIDISPDMCEKLAQKEQVAIAANRLKILNINLDTTDLKGQYDLITAYSVLHHLPDYLSTLEKLAGLVKKGGILYFDHEQQAGPDVSGMQGINKLVMRTYYYTDNKFNKIYRRFNGIPNIDYSMADVHGPLDWERIKELLTRQGFIVDVIPHYVNDSRLNTPLSYLRKRILKANSWMLIAKKT